MRLRALDDRAPVARASTRSTTRDTFDTPAPPKKGVLAHARELTTDNVLRRTARDRRAETFARRRPGALSSTRSTLMARARAQGAEGARSS